MASRRWRRMRMGLETVLGARRQGFFIPYRYAASVPETQPAYAEVEAVMARAEGAFAQVLDEIDARAEELAALDGPPPEPRWAQNWFARADAAAAYVLARGRAPKRIVEVGSGHSTRFLARALRDAGATARHVCIDPAHLPLFAELEAGDVAFFDSSHILQPGTDVDIILNRILPVLAPGVLAHVHDIFLPDPYPAHWLWRGYAEQNGLAPWLLSGAFRPVFSSHYAVSRMGAGERPGLSALPWTGAPESSLWMERAQGGSRSAAPLATARARR